MNKAELIAVVAGYLHRTDMADQISASIAMATARIGRDLRDRSNYEVGAYVFPDPLSANIVDMINVVADNACTLQALTQDQILQILHSGETGAARAYSIKGTQILFAPTPADGTGFYIAYYKRPDELVNDGDTNQVLSAWPQLYVYACLMESFFWTQDGDLTEYAKMAYINEIKTINGQYQSANVGTSPVMRRI